MFYIFCSKTKSELRHSERARRAVGRPPTICHDLNVAVVEHRGRLEAHGLVKEKSLLVGSMDMGLKTSAPWSLGRKQMMQQCSANTASATGGMEFVKERIMTDDGKSQKLVLGS